MSNISMTPRNDSLRNGLLSVNELKETEEMLLNMIQKKAFKTEYSQLYNKEDISTASPISKLDPFYDEQKQLLRVGGRLQFAQIDLEAKHQIIIPHHDELVEKLVLLCTLKQSMQVQRPPSQFYESDIGLYMDDEKLKE